MRHLLALAAVLALAGACLAAEFKSDEAKKAQADYLAALDAAKTTYGQGLAKAKATIAAKAAAATDAISKEAIQSESAAITEELVRLRASDAAMFEPRAWKSAETKKAAAAYAAELKAVQMKYSQDLTNAQRASLAKKAANPDAAVKQAFQQEADLIAEELKSLGGDIKAGKAREPVVTGRKGRGPGLTISGVQKEAMLTLSPSTKPHVLTGTYDVPVGKTLCLEAGVNLQCGPDSEINVNGTLIMEGTKEKPIVLNGMKSAPGLWKGITLREAEKCSLSWVELYDAGVGVFVSKCNPVMTSCTFANNNIGIKVDSRSNPPALMEDCVVSYNSTDGISSGSSSVTIRSCTISYNGGWGINGRYYPRPVIAASIITRNKSGGILLALYDSKAEAHDCAIGGNAGPDVRNECTNDLDFTKNYWGPDATQLLKKSGANVNLPSIFDAQDKRECGRVKIDAFLDKMPEKCGSSITSIKGRPVK